MFGSTGRTEMTIDACLTIGLVAFFKQSQVAVT
jgi:hypothetical protein